MVFRIDFLGFLNLSYMSQGSADHQNWNSKIILDFIIRRFVEAALFIRPVKTIGCSWGSFKHIQLETSCDTYTEITQLNHFSKIDMRKNGPE